MGWRVRMLVTARGAAMTDVLMVGAGPVGLTMAAELTRHGVRCRILDKLQAPSRIMSAIPRASGVRLAARVLRSGAGFVYQRVLMERNCCREFRSPPALVLCLEASSTVVDLINVAIHEAPCVCGPVKRHRQHFVSQPIAVTVENSLYDVDHAPPHREGVASGVAQASVDVVVISSSTASKAPRHSASVPVSLRSAPGRGSSVSARSRLPSRKRRLVR